MIARNIVLAAAALGALSPQLSRASTEAQSVRACARAFAESFSDRGTGARGYRLNYHGDAAGSMLSAYYPAEYSFALEAHAAKTGAIIARAVCTANSHGEVTAISAIPLDSKPAMPAGWTR
jgi:hypothetical protein